MKKQEGEISVLQGQDPTASERKKDHIALAFNSQVGAKELDNRFYYEPMLAAHPEDLQNDHFDIEFIGKKMQFPIWVSSMTGGTKLALRINHNLARMCKEFKLGMGLGSCRSLLFSEDRLADFDMRPIIGDQPLLANLGICQIEQLIDNNEIGRIPRMIELLKADGLIIHVNPLQEWLQPEGDKLQRPPLDTIKYCLENLNIPIIVKEVGQGFGPESMKQLMKLPLAAIDFAANGGTNFAKLEMMRGDESISEAYKSLSYLGHSAEQMLGYLNDIVQSEQDVQCDQVIISGGITSFLDGYYLIEKSNVKAIYGQASAFLKNAVESYEDLRNYAIAQIRGLQLAKTYLKIR